MLKLYLLRHAIAVDRETSKYTDDSKRPLTTEGKTKMKANAQGIKSLGISFDLILSSPYIRAKETAHIILDVLKIDKSSLVLTKELIPDAAFERLVREINAYAKKHSNIVLVGHEPHLSGLISFLLTGSKEPININFKKGGLALLTVENLYSAGGATLEWILAPSQLSKIS
jgi:phosphohistidine phosphatase